MAITRVFTNWLSAGRAPDSSGYPVNWLAVILGALLCVTGAVVLWLLPKVSADQRPLLRGVAMVQLSLGVVAVLIAVLGGLLIPPR